MRVLLVCNGGESAEVHSAKLTREIVRHGVAATVEATGLARALVVAVDYDAVLLAPQVAYAKRDVEKAAGSAPVWAIPQADYLRSNAKKIANDLLSVAGE